MKFTLNLNKKEFSMSKTVSKFALVAGFVLAMALTFSCSLPDDDGGSSSSGGGGGNQPSSSSNAVNLSSSSDAVPVGPVSYGGQTYRTVRIGTQTWFAENLNYAGEDAGNPIGTCYGSDDPADCVAYGRLYNWSTAMGLSDDCNSNNCAGRIRLKHKGICPEGWHIPSNDEWLTLVNFVGSYDAGTKLKSAIGWNNGNGTDDYGFSALPGGFGYWGAFRDILSFGYVGLRGVWWTTSEAGIGAAFRIRMENSENGVDFWDNDKLNLLSIRCLKD